MFRGVGRYVGSKVFVWRFVYCVVDFTVGGGRWGGIRMRFLEMG